MDETSTLPPSDDMSQKQSQTRIDLNGVSRRLLAVRTTSGLPSGEFADSVGIDRSSYSKIEAGKKPLNLEMGFRVSEKWGVSMDYLYRGLLRGLDPDIATSLRKIEQGKIE
ncbi:helix-turn-helix domain-containing protein [Mangrovicoccus sp. HB161399]|uniref:helix-turn-helix domain-containing protein n=1 Tax=Mangrovicoccus sp. HB161399 TaxID=2720392 RepID=UPI0020A6BB56|nr:helix-turn-helix transcriptional regulator [Mangrovicoccus sp. HB161399]